MTILITWFSKGAGGGERSTIELCNKLRTLPQVTSVVLLYAYTNVEARRLIDKHLHPSVSRYLVRTWVPLWHILGFLYVMYICLAKRPSLVQLNIRAALMESLAAKICGCPVIACLRIIPFYKRQLFQYLFVDHIVCISHAVYRSLVNLGWNKAATVIYNGINVGEFLVETTGVCGASNRFYTLGRLVGWKRHDWFIRAAASVKVQCPSAEFYIFGDGPLKPYLRAMIEQYGLGSVVHLMGWIDPEERLVGPYGIFVFPSYEEPFGRVLIEAALQGKVIVASRSGAVPELLPRHELLFDRDDIDGLTRLMVEASINFETYRIQAVRRRDRFVELFNLNRLVEDYWALYLEVIARKSADR